jgi:putative lipoprotein
MRCLLLAVALLALAAPAASAAPLEGTEWRFKTIAGERVAADYGAELIFQRGNKVSGLHDCNGLFGTYRVRGSRLRFPKLASTIMGCETPGANPDVLVTLRRTRAYRRTAKRLVLLNRRGRVIARLAPL